MLQFVPPFTTGMNATLAIGQAAGAANLTSNVCVYGTATTATGTDGVQGLAFDSTGNLWVSDLFNHRVLKYPAPITAGEAATVVLGQTTLAGAGYANRGTSTTAGPATASTLNQPLGLAFDSAGNLWVTDSLNCRVLMYPPANQVTGGAATVELGQPAGATAFTTNTLNNGGVLATSLGMPDDLVFDSAGNLWVVDLWNNRVLMYPKASLGTNGAAATVVLGQPDFTQGTVNNGGLGPAALQMPVGIGVDSSGRIAVADAGNNRTLVFAPTFSNGMNATLVLGQADLITGTSNTGGESAATQYAPVGVAITF